MRRNKAASLLASCLGLILIGCLIQAAGWLKGDALVFPGLQEILPAFFRLITSGKTWGLIWTTVKDLLASMAIATVLGVAIGVAEGKSDWIRSVLRPLMIMLRSLPMIVMTVIIMVLTDYSRVPVTAGVLILIPIISEATCEGFRHIDPTLIDICVLNSSFNFQVLWRVYLPLMAGYLKQAYVNAVGMGLKLAVSTEYLVQTKQSLGKAVYSSAYFNEYQDIYAYALIMILLVLLVGEGPALAGRWMERRRTKSQS